MRFDPEIVTQVFGPTSLPPQDQSPRTIAEWIRTSEFWNTDEPRETLIGDAPAVQLDMESVPPPGITEGRDTRLVLVEVDGMPLVIVVDEAEAGSDWEAVLELSTRLLETISFGDD